MARDPRPVFLERKSYRRRRLTDAMRLVVVLGMVLWLMPVLWSDGANGQQPVTMSRALFYVFGVWIGLIALSGAVTWRMRGQSDLPDPDEIGVERDP